MNRSTINKTLLFVLFLTTPWVTSMGEIITSCSPAEGGTIISLGGFKYEAIPNSGYTFDQWWVYYGLGDKIKTDNPCDFTNQQLISSMYADGRVYLTAYFTSSIDPTWQILYTSSDGNVVTPNKTDVFGANIVSNEYQDGQGVITFDGPVTSIGDYAFVSCYSLTSITIPNKVTSIGRQAFNDCSVLTSVSIPNSVKSIGYAAFNSCTSLTSLTIPEGVTSIGGYAFAYCSIRTMICKPIAPPTCGSNAFMFIDNTIPVYIPCGSMSAYKADAYWNYFTNIQSSDQFTITIQANKASQGTVSIKKK